MKEMVRQIEIDDKDRDEADFMADRVYEKLNTARNSYQQIKKADFAKLPTSNQKDTHEHLYSALWAAYKDCLQSILKTIGYDIGFMFVDDKNFDKQSKPFAATHPHKAWGWLRKKDTGKLAHTCALSNRSRCSNQSCEPSS